MANSIDILAKEQLAGQEVSSANSVEEDTMLDYVTLSADYPWETLPEAESSEVLDVTDKDLGSVNETDPEASPAAAAEFTVPSLGTVIMVTPKGQYMDFALYGSAGKLLGSMQYDWTTGNGTIQVGGESALHKGDVSVDLTDSGLGSILGNLSFLGDLGSGDFLSSISGSLDSLGGGISLTNLFSGDSGSVLGGYDLTALFGEESGLGGDGVSILQTITGLFSGDSDGLSLGGFDLTGLLSGNSDGLALGGFDLSGLLAGNSDGLSLGGFDLSGLLAGDDLFGMGSLFGEGGILGGDSVSPLSMISSIFVGSGDLGGDSSPTISVLSGLFSGDSEGLSLGSLDFGNLFSGSGSILGSFDLSGLSSLGGGSLVSIFSGSDGLSSIFSGSSLLSGSSLDIFGSLSGILQGENADMLSNLTGFGGSSLSILGMGSIFGEEDVGAIRELLTDSGMFSEDELNGITASPGVGGLGNISDLLSGGSSITDLLNGGSSITDLLGGGGLFDSGSLLSELSDLFSDDFLGMGDIFGLSSFSDNSDFFGGLDSLFSMGGSTDSSDLLGGLDLFGGLFGGGDSDLFGALGGLFGYSSDYQDDSYGYGGGLDLFGSLFGSGSTGDSYDYYGELGYLFG